MDILKQLQTTVAQTFENCFDNAYRDFNAELARRDARLEDAEKKAKAAEEARRNSTSEIARLNDEISLLQQELRQAEVDSKEGEFTTETSLQLKELYDPHHVFRNMDAISFSAEEMKAVSDKYAGLYEQTAILLSASGDLRRQVKRHKTKLAYFQKCLQRQEFTLLLEGAYVKFRRAGDAGAYSQENASVSNPTSLTVEKHEATNSGDSNGMDASTTDESGNINSNPLHETQLGAASTPSDLSDAETQQLVTPPLPASKYGKILKRKRGDLSTGVPNHPIVVKSETMSSSPLRTSSPPNGVTWTQDLDDIGSTIATPTKKSYLYRDQNIQARQEGFLPSGAGSSLTRHTPRPKHTVTQNQPTLRSGVLQPVNRNLRNIGSHNQQHKRPATKSGRKYSPRISSIAEDCDENFPPPNIRDQQNKSPQRKQDPHPSSEHRLQDLLERPSPTSRLLQVKENANTRLQSRRHPSAGNTSVTICHDKTDPTSSRVTTTRLESPRDHSRSEAFPQMEEAYQIELSPDDEPFRARPLRRLGLEHFKINPEYNQGLDFAYDEVIRRKDERKCLSGCTRRGCCGDKFRAMARFGIPADASKKQMGDREMLEEYLGDSHMVDKLSPEEREEILEEAKARDFSNRFGRHRHQHQRPKTPPGFWRTDMPGTQELEDDHEEAQKMERDKVAERYKEAMRPGGRWKFADE